ncbi:signal peptidase I [Anaerocolumna sedimenticola]|uniref:Signal peptidase I n=2 Tax=Anaerocolumna sedimenticola TaxID=2696063 RepID=A0A6P1TP92_9FIRM|nr:signal peptidase I [Anaerocolumna sedimenticola]
MEDNKDRSWLRVSEELNTTDDQELEQKVKQANYGKEISEMIIYFVVVIVSVLLIHQFVGQQIEVSGSSMESTLHNEDHLILEKVSYEINKPKRFDIVVFRPYEEDKDTYYIKRVIGLPGETIQIIGSDIYINDQLLNEDYGNNPIADGGIAKEPIVLGKDEYFLLGDNRNNSKDSRDSSIGAVERKAIIGRAWVRIWPFEKFGVLEHQ